MQVVLRCYSDIPSAEGQDQVREISRRTPLRQPALCQPTHTQT